VTLASVNTGNCGDYGDGDILTLNFYLANNLKSFTYVETDEEVAGNYADDFYAPMAGPATHF
jgi:hypothetical protein